MKSIGREVVNEIVINKSRFITVLCNVNNKDEVNDKILDYKNKYKDATHYCYAYIYNEVQRFSDDGEPGGTAGAPILNVLLKEKLNNVLCIVVRYFGGIKLGASGLVRAYTKSVTMALDMAIFQELELGYKIRIVIDYNEEKQINYLLGNSLVILKEYDTNVIYEALVSKNIIDKLYNYNYQIMQEIYIEKSWYN